MARKHTSRALGTRMTSFTCSSISSSCSSKLKILKSPFSHIGMKQLRKKTSRKRSSSSILSSSQSQRSRSSECSKCTLRLRIRWHCSRNASKISSLSSASSNRLYSCLQVCSNLLEPRLILLIIQRSPSSFNITCRVGETPLVTFSPLPMSSGSNRSKTPNQVKTSHLSI